jgi:hypothetical protein
MTTALYNTPNDDRDVGVHLYMPLQLEKQLDELI